MHNYRRIVCALVALGLFAAASTAQAQEPKCLEDQYKSYSWIDYGKCVLLRENSGTDKTNALTEGWFTRFQTTCPVKIDHPDSKYATRNCDQIPDALQKDDEASISRDDGVFYLTLRRPAENNKLIIDNRPLAPVKIKFTDGETRTVGYRTDRPVAVDVKLTTGSETILFDYYVYLSFEKYKNKQIKYYTIEAFALSAPVWCQAERPSSDNTTLVDCDRLRSSDAYTRASSKSGGDAYILQNRSGGGGEPMPNQ